MVIDRILNRIDQKVNQNIYIKLIHEITHAIY